MNQLHTFVIILMTLFTNVTPLCQDHISNFTKYKCEREIAYSIGSTGTSYLVSQKAKKFILKVQNNSKTSENELSILNKLKKQPYLQQLHEFKRTPSHIFMIIDFAENGNLSDFKTQSSYLNTFDNIVIFFNYLFVAVDTLHRLGFVHADLNTETILVDENFMPVLSDFGLSVPINDFSPPRGSISYLAPEIFKSVILQSIVQFSASSDLYSLGVLFYEVVKKRKPIKIQNLYFDVLVNSKIKFEKRDRLDFFEFVSSIVVPESKRIKYKDAENMLKKISLNQTFQFLKEDKKYCLRELATDEELKLDVNEISDFWYIVLAILVFGLFLITGGIFLFCLKMKKTDKKDFESFSVNSDFQTSSTNASKFYTGVDPFRSQL